MAEIALDKGGKVWGAKFNEQCEVVHDCVETIPALELLRGSKYVQSHIGLSFQKIKAELRKGKVVLFTGTPCQVAGLKRFLKDDYSNLYTIDFLCHGIPSPGVWKNI